MSTSIAGEASTGNKRTKCNRKWGYVEDAKLVEALVELVTRGGWRGDNGTFRSGYLQQLERLIEEKLPGCGLKATPYIESRVKLLKKQYNAITEMLGPNCSGFGWDDINKCVTCEEDTFKEWVKSHPNAQGMRNKPFPHFEDLTNIFGRDRATGMGAEAPADAVEKIEMEEQQYPYTSPAINESQEADSNFVGQNVNMNTPQTATHTEVAGPSRPTRTKKARHEALEVVRDLTSEMTKVVGMMAAAGDHIEKLAQCFKHESETADRRMTVVSEVMKVQGLSQSEILKVGKKIAMDPLETDYFFSLPDDYRRAYVLTLCSEFQNGM
ncbi:uncharacterized protein LOC120105506 [Phoenix dactylifera]|uniref:Uncharacterized protein LOC120105506 n=1 Tax=Phoenix dactylifera TaxID=42345 RepID=A0A8B8ZR57_PHODC|nr:uncharacterized protein LOC120105506 [Phoenix dactylifera]